MPRELHLHPDRLRAAAATAAGLAADLREAGAGPPVGETDRLGAAVLRAAGELVELSAALTAAASTAQEADARASRLLGRPT